MAKINLKKENIVAKRKSKKEVEVKEVEVVEEPLPKPKTVYDLRKNNVITALRVLNPESNSHLFKAVEAMLYKL